jgi:hypothetical protein
MTASELADIAILADLYGAHIECHAFGFMLIKKGSGHRQVRRLIAYSDAFEFKCPVDIFKLELKEMSKALE